MSSVQRRMRRICTPLVGVVALSWVADAWAQVETFDLAGATVTFIEDTPAPAVPGGSDAVIFNCVSDQGGSITNLGDEAGAADEVIAGNDLILISDSVSSGNIQNGMAELVDSPTPIINWEPAITDFFAIVGTQTNGDTIEGPDWDNDSTGPCIEIVDVSHPITNGLQPGLYNVYTRPVAGGMNDYDAAKLAPGATLLARTDAGRATFIVMDIGDIDNDGLPYARRHVELFINDPASDDLTDLGKTLINRSIAWALGQTLPPIANPPEPGCVIADLEFAPLPALAYVEEIIDVPDGEAIPDEEFGALVVRRAVDGTTVFEVQERFNFNNPTRGQSRVLSGSSGTPRTGNEVDGNFGIFVTQENVSWTHIIDMDPGTDGAQVPADVTAFTLIIEGYDLEGNQEAANDFRFEVTLDGLDVDADPLSPEGRWDTRPTTASTRGVIFARTFTLADNPDHIAAIADGELVVTLTQAGFVDVEFDPPNPTPGEHAFLSSTLLVGQEPIEALEVVPGSGVVNLGDELELRALATTGSGGIIGLGDQASFSSDAPGVASVDANGNVTGEGAGLATITVTFDDPVSGTLFTTVALIEVGDFIDLGDIVSAGDGKGNKLPIFDELVAEIGEVIAVDQDFGRFEALRFQQEVGDLNSTNPTVMNGQDANGEFTDDSPWIDSVFVINPENIAINSAGVRFDFVGDDNSPGGWEFILDGREPGGPEFMKIDDYESQRGVGIHASAGLTFDLDALRATHGADAVQFFSAGAGELTSDTDGTVNNYVILSDTSQIIDSLKVGPHNDSGEIVEVIIPAEARFLTLAVGDAGDGIGSDHGGFIDAFISRDSITGAISDFVLVAPDEINLIPERTEKITIQAAFATRGGLGIDLAGDPRVDFRSEDPAVASVDSTGLITGVGGGSTTVVAVFDGSDIGSVPVNVIGITTGEAVTISVQVAAGSDDAEEFVPSGTMESLTSSDLELGSEGGDADEQLIGIRFVNVDIPPGATINSASIQFTVDEVDDEPTSVRILGELTSDAAAFSSADFDISSRPQTTASADWLDIPVWDTVGDAGPDQETPDLTAIIQEIVNQGSWARGNALVILIESLVPNGERTAESFDGMPPLAPVLTVTWIPEAEPDVVIDFDTTGPTSSDQILTFFDLFGFDAVTGAPGWEVNANAQNAANGSNALHITSDGEELVTEFSRVAILKASEFEAENVEVSVDLTWDDAGGDADDRAGLYARFVDENNWYYLEVDAGPAGSGADAVDLYRSKDGASTAVVDNAASPVPIGEGDTATLTLRVDGNLIFGWINGILIPGIDPFVDGDPVQGAGRVGVGEQTNPAYYDNLTVRALAVAAEPPAIVGDNSLVFVLGCDQNGGMFETSEPVTVDNVTVTITGSDPAPGVTVTSGSLQVSLDAPLPFYQWLRLDVDVTGQTSGLSTTLTVFMAHTPLDINGDGRTNISDATAFGTEFNGGKDPNVIDENCDGIVNIQDATAFGTVWNAGAANSGPLPDKP